MAVNRLSYRVFYLQLLLSFLVSYGFLLWPEILEWYVLGCYKGAGGWREGLEEIKKIEHYGQRLAQLTSHQ